MKKYIFLLLSSFALLFLVSCQSTPAKVPATVERVVDGDTLKVHIGKKEETVRLLLVDPPESVHPTKPVQPFGPEASQYMKKLLPPGTKVALEFDVRERDKYGRLLAYVWLGNKMVNELLLEKGYARVAYVFEPNTKYVDEFRRIQEEARKKRLKIWSIEDYATDRGFREGVVRPSVTTASCPKPLIKGNITKNGEKIYHVPGSPQYRTTKAEVMFCTEKEAQSAGFRKPVH
ncbi:thermonuclease family protein [Anoxybacteroides amylolyticum]|uniref:SPBc2 prophage-derived endonuclease yokF n=1 Tax=Anoxybacteroides amylolyticum TaxID=294699 RepID=A0A160F6K0_9BACL|nr:thermonuclease family protein [Anoxybacillus amylolyticus]ANB61483.1 SPBc2 prophage-derived endonuclease yokF [Anoxybacillus amylolyticus]